MEKVKNWIDIVLDTGMKLAILGSMILLPLATYMHLYGYISGNYMPVFDLSHELFWTISSVVAVTMLDHRKHMWYLTEIAWIAFFIFKFSLDALVVTGELHRLILPACLVVVFAFTVIAHRSQLEITDVRENP